MRPGDDLVRRVNGELAAGRLAEARLREDCAAALVGRVHAEARRREAVDAIFDELGLLLQRSVIEELPGGERDGLVRRVNAVERRLAETLTPTGGTVHDALRAIIEVASSSVYGRALASAELFVQMTRRQLGELLGCSPGGAALRSCWTLRSPCPCFAPSSIAWRRAG